MPLLLGEPPGHSGLLHPATIARTLLARRQTLVLFRSTATGAHENETARRQLPLGKLGPGTTAIAAGPASTVRP
eukprot:8812553-Heterocapsa_arctica.AAC.1